MRLVPILLASLLAAGCVDSIEGRLRATNVEAPEWQVGDWWTYSIRAPAYGIETDVTVVVAEVNRTTYVVGTPAGDAPLDALLFHLPALGPVREDLSWDVHGVRFQPAQWPLEDGKSWDTTWIAADVHLTARLENGTWNITNAGFESESAALLYEIRYDPAARWFSSFTRTGTDGLVRQSIELVEYGRGFTGEVRAPAYIEVALLESRTAGLLSQGVPAAPNPTFTPPDGADTLLVACIAGGAPGQYHAELRSPTGVVCALDQTVPPGATALQRQAAEVAVEDGEWEARLAAAGQGSATVEVLAYPLRSITI